MFNLAIDSKLRGCDVVSIKIGDIAPNGHAIDRATLRQRKTGRPVRFELTEQTREAIDNYLKITRKKTRRVSFYPTAIGAKYDVPPVRTASVGLGRAARFVGM